APSMRAKAASAPFWWFCAEGEGDDSGPIEKERGPQPKFKRGAPLAVKIAAFAAVMVALAMSAVGYKLMQLTIGKIDELINETGVDAAKSYSTAINPTCFLKSEDHAAARDAAIEEWQKKLEAFVAKAPMFLNIMYTEDPKGTVLVANDRRTVTL